MASCPINSLIPIHWKYCSLRRGKRDAGSFPRAGPLKDSSRRGLPRAKPMKKRVLDAHLTQPCQPSPEGSPGRPAHRPFRGLLGVHSRCGLHTRAVTVFRDPLSEGFRHFVTSMPAPVASGWSGRRVGLAPTGKRRLFTAHTRSGRHLLDWATSERRSISDGVSPNCSRYLTASVYVAM